MGLGKLNPGCDCKCCICNWDDEICFRSCFDAPWNKFDCIREALETANCLLLSPGDSVEIELAECSSTVLLFINTLGVFNFPPPSSFFQTYQAYATITASAVLLVTATQDDEDCTRNFTIEIVVEYTIQSINSWSGVATYPGAFAVGDLLDTWLSGFSLIRFESQTFSVLCSETEWSVDAIGAPVVVLSFPGVYNGPYSGATWVQSLTWYFLDSVSSAGTLFAKIGSAPDPC